MGTTKGRNTSSLRGGGHGTSPDLIYAKGVPSTPDPDQTNFDKKSRILILIEIGLSLDLGCGKKHAEKIESTLPSSQPSANNTGGGWNLSPSPSAMRTRRSQGPSTTSLPPSPRSAQDRTKPSLIGIHHNPSRTPTPRATTNTYSSRC
jgi:hypothetical protein